MRKIRTIIILFGLIFISTISFAQEKIDYLSYFPKVEYNAKVAESNTSDDDTIFEKMVIDGFDSRVPFYVIKPKINKTNKFVFLLHGLTGSKENWVNPTSSLSTKYVKLKDSLVSIGYNVIIPDAKYHGERSYEADFASPVSFFATQDLQKIVNLYSTSVKDVRVIMDYMQSLAKEEQITFDVVGYSMGGLMAIYLNSVDNRLNRIVACVAPLGSALKAGMSLGLNEENAKKVEERFSSEIYAPLQKAPITLLMGTKDNWYTQKEAQDFYDNIEIKDKKLKFYESGHYLPEEFISDVIKSLNKK
ncbi:alpha/beta hydrolase [Psychroserpens ponticola]|uniref:Alpha/beta fold hydrolase n=1 Tax=Psychroserpens ponticola TaxID=2932268 RepID=A0ABY7S6K4_9FLAO|nr:alpha/beta fold hydrolase [Psychroserpens ponticola]WCO03525.1 alpha/beta fold hydrolase [Psychroserpens ponticola]